MKPARNIAHKIADIVLKSANNALHPDRMKNMYASSSTLSNAEGAEMDPEKSGAILNIWIDSIVEHVSTCKDRIISDYVLDLIENTQKHFENNYNEEELNAIVSIMEIPAFQKLWSDDAVFNIISDSKEGFNQHIIKEMQSEECLNVMQKKLHTLLANNGFDDNLDTSDQG